MAFERRAKPLSATNLDNLVNDLDVDAAAVCSVITVETSGSDFLANRNPKILFERHWFHRLTDGQFDAQAFALSQPSAGGY